MKELEIYLIGVTHNLLWPEKIDLINYFKPDAILLEDVLITSDIKKEYELIKDIELIPFMKSFNDLIAEEINWDNSPENINKSLLFIEQTYTEWIKEIFETKNYQKYALVIGAMHLPVQDYKYKYLRKQNYKDQLEIIEESEIPIIQLLRNEGYDIKSSYTNLVPELFILPENNNMINERLKKINN